MNLYLWDDVIGFKGDRSTGNRLLIWDTIQYLNSKNDFGFEIKLLETDYEWVKSGLVNLPNTSTYRKSELPSDVFNLNPLMTFEELLPYFHNGKKLPLKDNLITLAGFGPFKIFHTQGGGSDGKPIGGDIYSHPFVKQIEFNKESTEYQAQLQISIQNAQLDNQEDARKLQNREKSRALKQGPVLAPQQYLRYEGLLWCCSY